MTQKHGHQSRETLSGVLKAVEGVAFVIDETRTQSGRNADALQNNRMTVAHNKL